jgi:hypothetical protein
MTLQTLNGFDRITANNILAAAALATAADPGVDDRVFIKRYEKEVQAVLNEIRARASRTTEAEVDRILSDEIDRSVFADGDEKLAEALGRAGQAGRLSPAVYKVEQSPVFAELFSKFAPKRKVVEDAVRHPDDFQHLMTEGAVENEVISLFMKRLEPGGGKPPHWLLVQTHRREMTQVVQSAWRVYPDDVDLTRARSPLDVLKAFVETFGMTVRVGGRSEKFVESVTVVGTRNALMEITPAPRGPYFSSVSQVKTTAPGVFNVGIAYCIDLVKYAAALRPYGFSV